MHASWLNQVEIYFSILQRNATATGDFADLNDLANRILAYVRCGWAWLEAWIWWWWKGQWSRASWVLV